MSSYKPFKSYPFVSRFTYAGWNHVLKNSVGTWAMKYVVHHGCFCRRKSCMSKQIILNLCNVARKKPCLPGSWGCSIYVPHKFGSSPWPGRLRHQIGGTLRLVLGHWKRREARSHGLRGCLEWHFGAPKTITKRSNKHSGSDQQDTKNCKEKSLYDTILELWKSATM